MGEGYHETLPKPRPTGSAAVRGERRGAGGNPMRPSRPRRWGGTVRGVTSRGAVGGASADRAAWGRARLVAVAAGSIHEEALISCHSFYFSRHDTTLVQQGGGAADFTGGLPTLRGGGSASGPWPRRYGFETSVARRRDPLKNLRKRDNEASGKRLSGGEVGWCGPPRSPWGLACPLPCETARPTSSLTPRKLNAQESRRVLYPSCIVAPRYWRVLVLSGCLFKSEIGK